MGKLLAQLFQVTEVFRMRTQPQLLLLQKTLVVVEGLCRDLAPEADMWAVARTFLRKWLPSGVAATVQSTMEDAVASVQRIPDLLEAAQRAHQLLDGGALLLQVVLHAPQAGAHRVLDGVRRNRGRDTRINQKPHAIVQAGLQEAQGAHCAMSWPR